MRIVPVRKNGGMSRVIALVIAIIPAAATALALIFAGVLMDGVRDAYFSDMTAGIPSFVTIVFMPFTCLI